MTDFVDLMRQPLARGFHKDWRGEQCIMERVSLLWAMHTGQDPAAVFSDLPFCTNAVIARVAQIVNDDLSLKNRQKLNGFLPRLLRARRTDADQRVNVRLALWAARKVLHLAGDESRQVCERAIQTVELWLADPCDATAIDAAYAATAAQPYVAYAAYNATAAYAYSVDAAYAAYAAAAAAAAYADATDATYAVAHAAYIYIAGAHAADVDLTLLAFLDEALDQWEEAVTKEGEDLYIPAPWEDEALTFVSEYVTSLETE